MSHAWPMLLADSTRVDYQIELARWSSGNALILGIAVTLVLLYAALWLYRHEARGELSARRRWLLAGLRWSALVVLGLIGLEPVWARYLHRRVDAYTLVLIDESASMSVADRYRDAEADRRVRAVLQAADADAANAAETGAIKPTKAEQPGVAGVSRESLAQALARPAWIAELRKRNPVRVFAFSDRLREIPLPGDRTVASGTSSPAPTTSTSEFLPLDPSGSGTNIVAAVRQAVESLGPSPCAGVVLLSDGANNAGEPLDVLNRYLAARHIPLHAVGLGDASEPVNVRVADVSAPRMVFKNDPFQVTAMLVGEGVADRTIDVELLQRDVASGRSAEVVERRSVRPRADGRFDPVVFERRVAKPAELAYTVRAVPLDDETIDSDNSRETLPAVRVLEDRMRVLVVAGSPSYDYRYLARLLTRDRSVDVSCWLQSADRRAVREGSTIIDQLPTTPKDLYAYDAVVLFDPDPRSLPSEFSSLLASLVSDYGGGVLYAAGRKYSAPFFRSARSAPVAELLPVAVDRDAELILNDLGIYQRSAWPIAVPSEAVANPILRMSDNPIANRQIWATLEGVHWHYPVRREKPAATVLMRHSNPRMANSAGPHVLMATQIVGSGRTAFLGFDSSWRWRRADEGYFNRFWTQTLRYLVEGKLLGARSRGQLLTDKDRFTVGEALVITARALNEEMAPLARTSLELKLDGPAVGSRTLTLEPIQDRPGYFQGRFVPDRAGAIRLSLTLPGRGAESMRVERDVLVAQSDLELTNATLRKAALTELAVATGGRYWEVDDALKLPSAIEDRSETIVTRERPRPLWDNAYVFAALIAVLSAEWILRRVANLL